MFHRLILNLLGRRCIKGDILKADMGLLRGRYKGSFAIPEHYQGEDIICSKCKTPFSFSAKQKKEYYEGSKGNIYAKIHMCQNCYSKSNA